MNLNEIKLDLNDIINQRNYFSEGHANKLYSIFKDKKEYILRSGFSNVDDIYKYSFLFEEFFGRTIFVINPNTLLYEKIDGVTIQDKIKVINKSEEEKIFYDLGQIYARIHKIKYTVYFYEGKVFKTWVDVIKHKAEEIKDSKNAIYIDKFIELYYKHFNNYIPEYCLVHGDYSVKNVIIDVNNIYHIIDWDRFMIGDYLFDIANCLHRSFNRGRSNIEYDLMKDSFFKGYQTNSNIDLNEFINSKLYFCYLLYFNIASYSRRKDKLDIASKRFENRIKYIISILENE